MMRSFSGRVAILVVAVLLVTGLLNWAAAGYTMARLTRAEVERSTRGVSRGAAERIALLLELGKIELVTHAAAEPGLRSADPSRLQDTVARMRRELGVEYAFNGLALVGADGRLRAIDPPSPQLIGTDLSEREYVRNVLTTGRPYVSDAFLASTGRLVAIIAVPVTDRNGKVAGVLAGSLHLQKAENPLAGVLKRLEADTSARYIVLDRRRVVLYATGGGDGAGTPFPEDVFRRFLAAGLSTQMRDPRTGETHLGSYAPVPEAGWGVLALVPARAALAPIRRFHLQTFAVSSLSLALAALVALALSGRLVRPLHAIIAALRDVPRQRTGVSLPAGSAIEWRQLAHAFNRMVAELDEYERRMSDLASRDPLTGVLNRGALDEELAREMAVARRTGSTLAVLMLDLDDFKAYNDTYGHQAGDEVLRACAEVALRNVRDGDRVGRYGGEEFTVVLPDADCAAAVEVAERIRAGVAARRFLRPVTVSIGVACFPRHGETVRELIAHADEALYEAKRAGKDRTVLSGA